MISKILKLLKFNHRSLKYLQGSYSQFGEDFFLRHYFSNHKNGVFIDVGAYHPYKFSNMEYLRSQLGWKGVNIEPQYDNYKLLEKETEDINLNCLVSNRKGKVLFKIDGVCSSIAEGENVENTVSVESKRLEDIFIECKLKTVDFMSVDCEGYDIEVLETNNWDLCRPHLVAVEDHNKALNTRVDQYMNSKGYNMISWYNLTKFYVDNRAESNK